MMDRRYRQKMEQYWQREIKKGRASIDGLDFSTWFDLWHTHPDWNAKGNRFPESRAIVAKATYDLMLYAETKIFTRKDAIQIFSTICQDTGNNAIYIHTKNPNGTNYPFCFEQTELTDEIPTELIGVVDLSVYEIVKTKSEHQVGENDFEYQTDYVIQKRT